MTNSPASKQSPEPPQRGRSLWSRVATAVAVTGSVVVVGTGLGLLGARYFVYELLAPIVENTLTNTLDRPVELGEVQRFTPVGITFDGASIPTTATQTDYAEADTVQVGFNPVELLLDLVRDREIPITLKLIDSELFLVEEDGWLQTEIQPAEEEGPVTVVVQEVVVDNATVIANPKGSLDVNQQLAANDPTNDAGDVEIQSPVPVGSEGNNPGEADAEDSDAESILETEDTDGSPNVRLEPVVLEDVDAAAQFRNEYKDIRFEARGGIRSGGEFDIDGEADLSNGQRVSSRVQSREVAMSNLAALLPLPLAVEQGQLDSNVVVKYISSESRSPLQSLFFEGTAQVRDVVAQLDVAPKPVEDLNAQLRFQDQTVRLEETSLRYDQIPVEAGGSLDLRQGYDIQALVPEVTLVQLQETLNIPIPVEVAGAFTANANVIGPLEAPVVTGDVRSLNQIQVDRTAVDLVEAAFRLTPPLLSVNSFTILPAVGGEITGEGTVDLAADGGVAASINAVLPGDGLARDYGFTLPQPYQIGNLVADLEVVGPFDDIQAAAQWRLPQATYSGSGEVLYGDRQLRLQNTQFQVEGGTVTASGTAQLDQQTWQANVGTAGVQTGGIAPQVQGLLNADVALSGRLDELDLRAINAQGTAQLANANIQPVEGVDLVDSGTYQTGFRWTGDGIQVNGFQGPNVAADGFIGVDPAVASIITNFDLDVRAQDYELARLEPFLPPAAQAQAQLRGRATYVGQVSGTLDAPQANGQLALNGFGVNRFTFADLSGPVRFGLGQGGRVALAGGGDQITASVSPSYIPTDFTIENGDTLLTGETQDDILTAQLRDFPLQQLDVAPLGPETGAVQGIVNANVTANIADLSNPDVVARLAVAQPGLGRISGERFTGEVAYRNNMVSLSEGDLDLDGGQYRLSGRLGLGAAQPFAVDIAVQQGQLETAINALQLVAPVGDAAGAPTAGGEALTVRGAGRPLAPLLEQLVYATKLAAAQEVLVAESESLIPDLEALSGTYDAALTASGQLATGLEGLTAEFALDGENWAWGQYDEPNQVTVAGNVANATLALDPLRFEAGESVVAYSGTLGLGPQSGELSIEQVPVPLLQGIAESFVAVPVELDGTLSAVADLDGSLEAPVIDGTVTVADATVNGERLDDLGVDFRYAEALFTAEATLASRGPDTFLAQAQIPYALPFMAVQPTSDEIDIEAVLQNDGLALVGVVSGGQVQWEGGDGLVRLDVAGALAEPQVAGAADFEGGQLAIAALDDPITDLNGIVAFNLQRVEVETLNAKLNGGDIVITGDLPVFDPAQSGALQVTLDQVPIDLDVETAVDVAFSATVDGDLQVTGAATEPTLGGTVQIADGRVDPISGFIGGLGLLGGGSTDKAAPVPEEVSSDRPPQREIAGLEQFGVALERSTPDADSFASRIGFNDLRIILADDLEIAGQPFFNIEASGDLTVNGTLASLRPDGRLMLDSGWINIYTTQFRLDRGEPQVVILEPERGLDPILRVTAIADVPESQQTPVPPSSPFASSEVADQAAIPSFGGFETVEVTARIDGPLSQLSENLELESQPARTDSQLVALIGGGLVNQLAQGDTALALASYVGSGTFASFSNEVVDALGLDLFRIFPTTDVGGDSSLPISIGVEAGVDVTDDLSLTVLQLIGSTSPPQFGARYRLTDELQIRANTDLEEDTRGVLEYQIRF